MVADEKVSATGLGLRMGCFDQELGRPDQEFAFCGVSLRTLLRRSERRR